jgi:hypothetical protein
MIWNPYAIPFLSLDDIRGSRRSSSTSSSYLVPGSVSNNNNNNNNNNHNDGEPLSSVAIGSSPPPIIWLPANPEKEAARMAALKRLRHRLVSLCSQQPPPPPPIGGGSGRRYHTTSAGHRNHAGDNEEGNGGNNNNNNNTTNNTSSGKVKPPTLAFERWLSRCALAREQQQEQQQQQLQHRKRSLASTSSSLSLLVADPVIPSTTSLQRETNQVKDGVQQRSIGIDNLVPDPGLVRDLARCMDRNAARQVAEIMTKDAQEAAYKIANIGRMGNSEATEHGTDSSTMLSSGRRVELKQYTKAVQVASKAVQKLMKEQEKDRKAAEVHQTTSNALASPMKNTLITSSDSEVPSSSTSSPMVDLLGALAGATKALHNCQKQIAVEHNNKHGPVNADHHQVDRMCPYVTLDTSRRNGICDVTLFLMDGSPKKPYMTISVAHLAKFVQLWQFAAAAQDVQNCDEVGNITTVIAEPKHQKVRTAEISATDATTIPIQQTISALPDSEDFKRSLYCCLARYESIQGAGYQCAVPPAAFDAALHGLGLGTTMECFASPFNCRYRNYCSAFSDLETRFGSVGSFFDDDAFFPRQGSFEANPPFVPEIMSAMNEKLQRILMQSTITTTHEPTRHNNDLQQQRRPDLPLSFLVVVPIWGSVGISHVQELESSIFVRAKARVAAADHSFCDGAQHKNPTHSVSSLSSSSSPLSGAPYSTTMPELRPSSWDTAVVILQNDAGAKRWPVSDQHLEDAFCSVLRNSGHSNSSMGRKKTLSDWEHRGVNKGGRKRQRL